MSAIQRKSAKKQQEQTETEVSVQQEIEIPLPQPKKKEKGSSKQEPAQAQVVVDDDSTPSVAVAETKPSKKGKKSAPKSDEEEAVESKKVESGDEGEVVEKSKKQPPKSLGEQMTDSVEILANQSEKFKVLIELKEALHKNLTSLISSRKKELKKHKEDESEDAILQFLEKQKDSLKDEIAILKSSIRELTSVSKVVEKATKQLDSKKKDPSKPKNTRPPIFVAVSTDSMNQFIQKNLTLTTNDGKQIFEQTPETNSDGRFLVERKQLMQLIHAYIREKSLKKDGFIELDDQLKTVFHAYLNGDFSKKVNSTSVMSIISYHLEKKA